MTHLIELLRRRQLVREHETALQANDSLADASRTLRRRAQEQINAGHPERAQPFIDEALLFENAMQKVSGL